MSDTATTSNANVISDESSVVSNMTDAQIESANKQLALEERKQAFEEHKQILAFQSEQRRLAIADAIHNEGWFKAYWRPAAGWIYLLICLFDFVIAPLTSMMLPILTKSTYVPWTTLTLQNGGLIHMAFGAILGIAAWTKGQAQIEQAKSSSSNNSN